MTDRAPDHSRIGASPTGSTSGRMGELWGWAAQNRGRSLFWIAYAVAIGWTLFLVVTVNG